MKCICAMMGVIGWISVFCCPMELFAQNRNVSDTEKRHLQCYPEFPQKFLTKMGSHSCYFIVSLYDLPKAIAFMYLNPPVDSNGNTYVPDECQIRFEVVNSSDTIQSVAREFGKKEDIAALITPELYKKTSLGYTKAFELNPEICCGKIEQSPFNFYLSLRKGTKLVAGEYLPYIAIRLQDLFVGVTERGEYKLTGCYKNVCPDGITYHRLRELYFEIK